MFNLMNTQAQERLHSALNRYDYNDAIHIIDSLMATDKADSVGLAQPLKYLCFCVRKEYSLQ